MKTPDIENLLQHNSPDADTPANAEEWEVHATAREIKLLRSDVEIWKGRVEALRSDFCEVAEALGCDVKDNDAMIAKIQQLQSAAHVMPGEDK